MTTAKKKKQLRSKADKLWFEAVFAKYGNRCEVCGKQATQAHHFFPKGSFGHLRYNVNNGIQICQGCHFSLHFKSDPTIVNAIIQKRGLFWYDGLKDAKREPSFQTIKYYEEVIKKLCSKK